MPAECFKGERHGEVKRDDCDLSKSKRSGFFSCLKHAFHIMLRNENALPRPVTYDHALSSLYNALLLPNTRQAIMITSSAQQN